MGCGNPSQRPKSLWLRGVARGELCWLHGLLARPLLRIRYGSPLRRCAREAALPAASSSHNGLYAIYSAVPSNTLNMGIFDTGVHNLSSSRSIFVSIPFRDNHGDCKP